MKADDPDSLANQLLKAIGILVAVWLLTYACYLLVTAAFAHEFYPQECCAGKDCQPVACDALREEGQGAISYSPREATYPPKPPATYIFDKRKVRPSLEDRCHVCISYGLPVCVFVQQGS